jgi:predicted DCC family thiol-disulfide oxidoreductase YuxK
VTVRAARFTVGGRDVTDSPLAAPRMAPARCYTVIYDGDCKVCEKMIRMLRKWDRNQQLEIVPSQDSGVCARFPWIPSRAYTDSIQVVRASDGKTWQAAAALEELLGVLPKGRLISWLFKIPFARPLADRFYRWFARNRSRFGCSDHCQMRRPDLDYGDE